MTKEQRSKTMSRIRSKDTKAEVLLRKALYHEGYRYRKNYKELPGKPDIVLTKYKLAIFCDGEFFHGKDFDTKKPVDENRDYWDKKIRRNMERDQEVNQMLAEAGWRVLRFWNKEIIKDIDNCLRVIRTAVADSIVF